MWLYMVCILQKYIDNGIDLSNVMLPLEFCKLLLQIIIHYGCKKIEKISTFAGVVLLALLAVFGILGCFELVFDIDYLTSRRTDDIWTVSL